jgi:hypothetical protein
LVSGVSKTANVTIRSGDSRPRRSRHRCHETVLTVIEAVVPSASRRDADI